jgi:hypothetical protein
MREIRATIRLTMWRYTRQWEPCASKYPDIPMASIDTLEEYQHAKAKALILLGCRRRAPI